MKSVQLVSRLALRGNKFAEYLRTCAPPLLAAKQSLACDTAGSRCFEISAREMSCKFPTIIDDDPHKPPGRARTVWRQEDQVI